MEANLTVSSIKDAKKKIDTIVNSEYSKSLNTYLKLCDRKSDYLNTKIEKIKAKKSFACALPLLTMSSFVFFLAVGAVNSSILLLVSALILSASISLKMLRSCIKQLQNFDIQLYTLTKIKEYFESEKKISNEYNSTLVNFNILEIEKLHDNKLNLILGNDENIDYIQRDYLSNLISQYSNEHEKNLIIIEQLKKLDDKKKKEYLDSIYNQTGNNFIKTNINIGKKLLIGNKNVDDDNTTGESTNTKLNSNIKPISLKKDGFFPYYKKDGIIYKCGDPMPPLFQEENKGKFQDAIAINTPDELNSIFAYQQGEVPPNDQDKGQQFSKKFLKF